MGARSLPLQNVRKEVIARLTAVDQIARFRMAKGMTQAQLGARIGTKQPGIARLEAGRQNPGLEILYRIAEALDCELEVRLVPKGEGSGDGHEDAAGDRKGARP